MSTQEKQDFYHELLKFVHAEKEIMHELSLREENTNNSADILLEIVAFCTYQIKNYEQKQNKYKDIDTKNQDENIELILSLYKNYCLVNKQRCKNLLAKALKNLQIPDSEDSK